MASKGLDGLILTGKLGETQRKRFGLTRFPGGLFGSRSIESCSERSGDLGNTDGNMLQETYGLTPNMAVSLLKPVHQTNNRMVHQQERHQQQQHHTPSATSCILDYYH